jgi:hypothetical protein
MMLSGKIMKSLLSQAAKKEPEVTAFLKSIFEDARQKHQIPETDQIIGATIIIPNPEGEEKVYFALFAINPKNMESIMVSDPIPFAAIINLIMYEIGK